jgi:hypothetical protein
MISRILQKQKKWAKENITGTYHNENTDKDISISKTAIDKYLSEKTIKKSASVDVHLSAIKQIPKLIETSVLKEKHNDRNEDSNIQEIQRLYGAIKYEGRNYPVKITVKVIKTEGNKAYNYEVMQIASPVGTHENRMLNADFLPRTTGLSVNKSQDKGTNISGITKSESAESDATVRFHVESNAELTE